MAAPAHTAEALIETLELVRQHGTVVRAAEVAGISRNTLQARFMAARARLPELAARYGFATGHFESGVAPGYLVGKVTVQRNGLGEVVQTWERQSPEGQAAQQILDALDRRIERQPVAPVVKPPKAFGPTELLNQVTIADGHVGALAWSAETGTGNWDLDIAHDTLLRGSTWLMDNLPAAETLLLLILGDYTDTDGYAPLTPAHKHLLDVDGRFPKIADVGIEIVEQAVLHALGRYKQVILRIEPGNHDPLSAFWMRKLYGRVFEKNPRVTVDSSLRNYWALTHGKTMIATHHGDKANPVDLPGIFAADFAEQWGATTYRVCHSGHWHHRKITIQTGREARGMMLYQHPTLNARNAWAADKGLVAARELHGHSYHSGGALITTLAYNPDLEGAI